jgi:anti-anti-sigma regulatory factor
MVSVKGIMDSWHAPTFEEALQSFFQYGTTLLALDMSELKFAGVEGASALLRAFRSMRPEMKIHVVAQGYLANLLHKAKLGACVEVHYNLDEVAESIRPVPEYTTSRWMAYTDDVELPLAA